MLKIEPREIKRPTHFGKTINNFENKVKYIKIKFKNFMCVYRELLFLKSIFGYIACTVSMICNFNYTVTVCNILMIL